MIQITRGYTLINYHVMLGLATPICLSFYYRSAELITSNT